MAKLTHSYRYLGISQFCRFVWEKLENPTFLNIKVTLLQVNNHYKIAMKLNKH